MPSEILKDHDPSGACEQSRGRGRLHFEYTLLGAGSFSLTGFTSSSSAAPPAATITNPGSATSRL